METFSMLLAFVQEIHRSLVNSPHKGQWCGALTFSLIEAWLNVWANNHEAGDLRCHCAHDVTVMSCCVQYYSILENDIWRVIVITQMHGKIRLTLLKNQIWLREHTSTWSSFVYTYWPSTTINSLGQISGGIVKCWSTLWLLMPVISN